MPIERRLLFVDTERRGKHLTGAFPCKILHLSILFVCLSLAYGKNDPCSSLPAHLNLYTMTLTVLDSFCWDKTDVAYMCYVVSMFRCNAIGMRRKLQDKLCEYVCMY